MSLEIDRSVGRSRSLGFFSEKRRTARELFSRRRFTIALIVIPCILSIATVVAIWVSPSASFHDFIHRFSDSNYSYDDEPTLVSRPKISDPNKPKKSISSNSSSSSSSSNNNNNDDDDDDSNNNNNKHDASSNASVDSKIVSKTSVATSTESWTMVPNELLNLGVYDEASDFVNEMGIKPTGWEHENGDPEIWGPCRFVPSPPEYATVASVKWTDRRRRFPSNTSINNNSSETTVIGSPDYYRNADVEDFEYLGKAKEPLPSNRKNIGGWCRPGFLIIGAGKCGTSSLYHYLIGHPRILPAFQKQIHYFKYHDRQQPLASYYGNFPTPQSFLEHGGLMTGEASPGYLPYPEVAKNAHKAWKGTLSQNGAGEGSHGRPLVTFLANPSYKSWVPEVPPRIIAVGREPFDRILSSYNYNYVVPTIQYLRRYGHPRIPAAKNSRKKDDDGDSEVGFQLQREDDEYYLPYLFSLEEFIRAELKQLKRCLYDFGPEKTYTKWHRDSVYKSAVKLRNRTNRTSSSNNSSSILLQPLIDLDGICYGTTINKTVYREQWAEMQMNNPDKVLRNMNLHLTQAMIGRSLYVFPLDWWYLNFKPEGEPGDSISFVCTEDLAKPDTLNNLTAELGLPKYDGFDAVVAEGAYNVGGHRGYDTATSWEEIELEHESQTKGNTGNDTGLSENSASVRNGYPLPEDLYQELKEFIDPLNERLFELVGKRCDW